MDQTIGMALLELFSVFFLPMGALVVMYYCMLLDPRVNGKKINKQLKKHSLLTQWIIYWVRKDRVKSYRAMQREVKRLERQQEKIQDLHMNKVRPKTSKPNLNNVVSLMDYKRKAN